MFIFSLNQRSQVAAKSFIVQARVQYDQKKSLNVYKSCPKMISRENVKILSALQKLPKNVGVFGKLIVAKGFKKFPKVQ